MTAARGKPSPNHLYKGLERLRSFVGHRSAVLVASLAMGCASGPEAFSTVPPVASGTSAADEIETTLILEIGRAHV